MLVGNMKVIKTYSTRLDAEVAKIALAAEDIPAVVVGVGSELEGGSAGVQLLVSEESLEAARKVLAGS
jgi:Putative prokaryotic signal transducing protein